LKTRLIVLIIMAFAIYFTACSEDAPSEPKSTATIQADRVNLGFNDEINLQVMVDGAPASGYSYEWSCNNGEFISGADAQGMIWKSPQGVSSSEISVQLSGGSANSPENISINSVAPFYDNFSGSDSHWHSTYVNTWISDDDQLHFKGASRVELGILYSKVNAESTDKFVLKSTFAPVSSRYTGGYEYGIYFKTRDTVSVKVNYEGQLKTLSFYSYMFIISNIDSTLNFYVAGYTEFAGERKWVLVDGNLMGHSDAIVTEFNHYLDFEWIVYPDKLIEIKVGGESVAVSYLFMAAENQAGKQFDVFPQLVGFRTVHETEIAAKNLIVEDLPLQIAPSKAGSFDPAQPIKVSEYYQFEF